LRLQVPRLSSAGTAADSHAQAAPNHHLHPGVIFINWGLSYVFGDGIVSLERAR